MALEVRSGLFGGFQRNEDGSATIEFVLWVPIIFSLVLLATDVSIAFMRQSQSWQVARDTARIVSRHGMTENAAVTYAEENTKFGSTTPAVTVRSNGSVVEVSISTPANAMTVFGTINFALGESITTRVVHAMEPA